MYYLSRLQCNKEHVKKWTNKYINENVKSGTAEQRKEKIKNFLDRYYPNFSYVIIVYGDVLGWDNHATNFDIKTFRYEIN